ASATEHSFPAELVGWGHPIVTTVKIPTFESDAKSSKLSTSTKLSTSSTRWTPKTVP
ncbi:hypothetical protein WICPIJ_009150, partial [Wickerhamomyces pijperi]